MNEKNSFMLIGASSGLAIGFGLGFAAGYFLLKKRLEVKYADLSTKEIAEAKIFYSRLNKKDAFETPEAVVESLGITNAVEALESYQGNPSEEDLTNHSKEIRYHRPPKTAEKKIAELVVPEPKLVYDAELDFDYAEEVKNRSPEVPYIISEREYLQNEEGHDQVNFDYYSEDDVLLDENDEVVPDSDSVVGDANLLKFGHGSGDPNTVFIRNEGLTLEFEVSQHTGKYTEEVLGFFEPDEHEEIHKFRGDDG